MFQCLEKIYYFNPIPKEVLMQTIREELHRHIHAVNMIDSHSHMGSTHGLDFFSDRTSLRNVGAGSTSTGIFELLTCPYTFWGQPRFTLNTRELHTQAETDLVGAFQTLEPELRRWQTQGQWQCMRIAFRELYDFDEPITVKNIERLDEKIRASYAQKGYYERGRDILNQAGIVSSLKMVEPQWMEEIVTGQGETPDALVERGMIHPTLLIDSAVQAPERSISPDRLDAFCKTLNRTLKSPDDYRQLIFELFQRLDTFNATDPFGGIAGLKSATAYKHDLGFHPQSDADFDAWIKRYAPQTGTPLPPECDASMPQQYLMRHLV